MTTSEGTEPPVKGAGTLLHGAAALICIGFAVWLVYAWTHYGERYAAAMEGWRLGGTHVVEVSVVAEDRMRLACASDVGFGPVRCGFDEGRRALGTSPEHLLSPFNTVRNQLFLGAGLWAQPALQSNLPQGRFTVVCNLHILGVMRPSLRWTETGRFDPLKENIAAGTFSDCEIPR